jgi:DTW domain-containing protein
MLQHPHERRKYYSTAKMVALAIENSRLMRGLYFEEGVIEKALVGQDTYLLFPGEGAQSCLDISLNETSTVVVLDGTWSEAGKLLRRNPILERLPRLSFSTPLQSNYRIRKQPKSHYLSTLESIGHLLIQNARAQGRESDCENYQGLFRGFDQMVEQQLKYFPRMKMLPLEKSAETCSA